MDCLRSGRDGPVVPAGVDTTLEGRLPVVGWLLPKKSRPKSESAGFCFGAAWVFGGGGRDGGGSTVLGLAGGAGASSSPKRSIFCAGRRRGGCEVVATLAEAERSNLAFSWTIASGCRGQLCRETQKQCDLTTSSSPLSSVEGSGIGPSITHRLDSYFVRMKFSIFLHLCQLSRY